MNFLAAFSLGLLSLCDSVARTVRPCNSSLDQLRHQRVIGSKFHICNFDLGFRRIAPNVEAFTTRNISKCCFWSFRAYVVLRISLVFTFVDNFDDVFFSHKMVHDDGVDTACQNSFQRRGQQNSVLCILFRSPMNCRIPLPRFLRSVNSSAFVCIVVGEEECMIFFFTFFSTCHQLSF